MADLNAWSLVQQGFFEEACKIADIEFENTQRVHHLRNKVYALFHLKRFNEIITLLEFIIKIEKGESASDFINLGISNWMVGETVKAIEVWKAAQSCIYKDAAGGIDIQVFLYFAAIKTGNEKLKLATIKYIKTLFKSKQSFNWPGPIGHFLLNELTENELIPYTADIPILKERQLCQAYFVIAVKKLETHNNIAYYDALEKCTSYGASSYLEPMYYLAKGNLELK